MTENRGNLSGFDFLQIVEDSRKLPETPAGSPSSAAVELPAASKEEEEKNPFLEEEVPENKVAVPTHYLSYSRVFVLWKDWEGCAKCLRDIAKKEKEIEVAKAKAQEEGVEYEPELGEREEWECPHNHRKEYKETLDRCLRGDGVIVLREAFNLKNGTRCMHLEWVEADPEFIRKQEEQARIRKENQVYPPDVDAAFSKGKKAAEK